MRPKPTVAFLLWLLVGFLSGYRFYLGRRWSAILQILCRGGGTWWIVDAFSINSMIARKRDEIRRRPTAGALAGAGRVVKG